MNKLEIIIQMICTLRKTHFKIICILNEYKHPNDLYITWVISLKAQRKDHPNGLYITWVISLKAQRKDHPNVSKLVKSLSGFSPNPKQNTIF